MRTKSFLLFLCCVVATSLLLILLGPQRNESIQNIVSQTHRQIKSFQENLNNAKEKNLSMSPEHLVLLGFNSPIQPNGTWAANVSQPTVISYALRDQLAQVVGLLRSVSGKWPHQSLLIYDLGLSADDLIILNTHCNNTRCAVLNFPFDQFPSYVSEEQAHAFRPLIIQDALLKCGSIIFLENSRRIHCSENYLQNLLNMTLKSNVLGWSTKHAVSSLTHPKMFEYFHKDKDSFLFLPMLDADPLLMINSQQLQTEVMLPWAQCALTQDCIHPIGAQSGGCRFDKKPQYRYSGCHAYDTSALNIILGLRHGDEYLYSLKDETDRQKYFPEESAKNAAQTLQDLMRNFTEVSDRPNTISNF